MARSTTTTTSFLLFVVLLVAMNTHSALGLAGVFNRIRNTNILGRKASRNRRNANLLLPARKPNEAAGDQYVSVPETSVFDIDTYRQEMIDLVYERNMQRAFNR